MATNRRVDFQFMSADESYTILRGSVLVRGEGRGQEMVLEITDPAGNGPYLLIGRFGAGKSYFRAANTADGRESMVEASWAEVRGAYVGLWMEEGAEFLFRFLLPK